MSTIYEALRKAEARRRLGEAPSLIGDAAWAARKPARAHESRRRWLPWLLPVVVAALAGGWWLGRGSAPAPSTAPVAVTVAPTPSPPPAPPQSAAPSAAPISAAPSAAPVAGPALVAPAAVATSPVVPPTAIAVPDAASANAAAPAGGAQAAVAGPVPSTARPGAPAPASRTAPPVPAPVAAPAPTPDAATPAPSVPAPAATAAPPFAALPPTSAALAPPAAVASALAPGGSPGVPLLYEMPLGTRQALPPLKLSMHVYSPDPARRVVIIDGTRLIEGETVSGELKVAQITSDGVVLQLGDQVFLLPRGGR